MTSLRERLQTEMTTAMKARNADRRDALRFLLAGVKTAEIDKRTELTPDEEIAWLKTAAKQRRDAIELFQQGGRTDLAEREQAQLDVLEEFLPQQMTEDELAAFVKSGIEEVGASSARDMGKVMGLLNPRSAGRVDGRRLADAVKNALG